MRRVLALGGLLSAACVPGAAQVEELFSAYAQVFYPQGEYPRKLVRAQPPSRDGWKRLDLEAAGLRLAVPEGARVDSRPAGTRILEVVLAGPERPPRPTLRVDLFRPEAGEPAEVDAAYVRTLVAEYPKQTPRFTVTDSALLVVARRHRLALLGGRYPLGGAHAYRLQCTYLARDRQLFFTFDCPDEDWERYEEVLARILLSTEVRRKGKG